MQRLACSVGLALFVVPSAHADPFLVRNQNPLLALYGLPSPMPARLPAPGSGHIAGVVNWSNSAVTATNGQTSFTVDGEVFEARAHLERALSKRFAVHAELAWRQLSEGSLDDVIDDWHGIFGLPDGSRDQLPVNELLIEYRADGTTQLRVDESTSGAADIPIALGYQLHASETRALATWLTVKAPVGSVEDFTGSGAMDVAVTLAGDYHLGERWQLFGQVDLAWLGEGDLLPELQEDYAWALMAGVTWNAWRGLDLTTQVAANSAVFDSGATDFDGDAVVLTFGGSYRTTGGWHFDLGISEDIEVDASPDVAFNFVARRGF
jgi:hypothetical protein